MKFKHDDFNTYDRIIWDYQSRIRIDKANSLKFLVFEDTQNKRWIAYNAETALYQEYNFGEIVAAVLNDFIDSDSNAVHHERMMKIFADMGADYNESEMQEYYNETKEQLQRLLDFIAKAPDIRKAYANLKNKKDRQQMYIYMMSAWQDFRYANYRRVWRDYITQKCVDIEELKKKPWFQKLETQEEKENFVKSLQREANEQNDTMHSNIDKYFMAYYDNIIMYDREETPLVGRAFVSADISCAFGWDLYHVLVSGLAYAPHVCPLCGHLFYSNKNTAAYCTACRESSTNIYADNLKNSVRYIHKKIYNKILRSKKYDANFRNAFVNESNHYWNIVQGKCVEDNPAYAENIKTESDYRTWLENQLASL